MRPGDVPKGLWPRLAFVCVQDAAAEEDRPGGKRARTGNGKRAVLRWIGISRQVSLAAVRRQAQRVIFLPQGVLILIPGRPFPAAFQPKNCLWI